MKGISAYILDDKDRTELALWHFPFLFDKRIGHHVTYQFGSSDKDPLPPGKKFQVVGYARADDGLEALVIAVDGSTKRPDGGTYHITWSLQGDYRPKDSNTVIKQGWTKLDADEVIDIKMEPVFLPFN